MPPATVANARKKLEEELEEQLKAVVMIKRRLNAITTISRLPTELLLEIFVCIAEVYFRKYVADCPEYGSNGSSYPRGRGLDCIRLAHVCHAWRDIALNTPRLWSFIPFTGLALAELLLVRSKRVPLTVAIHSSSLCYEDHRRFLEAISSGQTSRLTELSIESPSSTIYKLCGTLTEPANILHTLSLSEEGYDGIGYIPYNLFNGHTPRLRSLEIDRLVIRWDNPLLCSTLTRLVIEADYILVESMGTFEQLLSALELMTSLHTLELTDAIPEVTTTLDSSSPSRIVTLSHLSTLCLNGYLTRSFARFLDHLSLPTHVLPQLTCGGSEPFIFDLIVAVKAHLARPLRLVQLKEDSSRELLLHAWNTIHAAIEPPALILQITIYRNLGSSQVLWDLFQRSSAFIKIQTLVVEPEDNWSWTAIFSGTPNLRELVIRHAGPQTVLVALSSTSTVTLHDRGEAEHTSSPLLPLLEVVRFHDVRLDGPEFVDCLIFRCNYNCPIQEVHITHCRNITEEDVVCLQEIVPEVVWDWVQGVPDEDEEDEDEEDEDEEDEDEEDEDEEDEDEGDEDEYTDNEDEPFEEDMAVDSDPDRTTTVKSSTG